MVPQPFCRDHIKLIPSSSGTFSSKSTWQALRVRRPKVPWHALVWFSEAIPKTGIILWLAIRGRLGTKDRLHTGISPYCLLCDACFESHDHLFFNCTFSKTIWEELLAICGLHYSSESWEDRIALMAVLTKGKGLLSTIRKLSLAVSIYFIWQERNIRLHDQITRSSSSVL